MNKVWFINFLDKLERKVPVWFQAAGNALDKLAELPVRLIFAIAKVLRITGENLSTLVGYGLGICLTIAVPLFIAFLILGLLYRLIHFVVYGSAGGELPWWPF